ncbi:hypothetical protein ZIOFF_045987 [Zingiber officinale]|uniref:PHD-type domain-containing protein n=1 Tax=Zingiber officinale TaxID=94328 RepID=A0A8J5FZH3_ZINOF|nr:hypothetical protein ZIOFF_045987 [Zingiber officinale]
MIQFIQFGLDFQIYQPSEGEIRQMLDPYGNIVCTECQQAVDDHLMLLCDICDSCAHTYCVGLGREVPEGNWYCDCCRSTTTVSSCMQNQDTFSGGVPKSSLTHGYEAVEDAAHIHSNSYSQPSGSFPRLIASQRMDLNAPPTLDDDYAAIYQVTGVGGSTLSERRAIHQQIRILLSNSRPRQMIHQNDVSNDKVEGNATPQEVQQSEFTN